MIKKFILVISILVLTSGGVVLATANDKENICHATSSETNPYEAISVADNNNTHDGHVNDFPYLGPVKDNGQPTKDGDQWCEDNAPKEDVCENIEGIQESVPEGYELKDGQCTKVEEPPTDNPPVDTPEKPEKNTQSIGNPNVKSNPIVPLNKQEGK